MKLCGSVDVDQRAGDEENPEGPPQEQPAEQPACLPLKQLMRIKSAPARDTSTLPAFEPPKFERTESAPAGAMQVEEEDEEAMRFDTMNEKEKAVFQRLKTMVRVMDNGFTVPVINYKFGMDAVVGLVPYAGDVSGAVMGTYIMSTALKYHLPRRTLMRMMLNQAIDSVGGICPVLGDWFDFTYKANHRNLLLVEEHLKDPGRATMRDCCFLTSLFFFVVVLPLMLVLSLLGAIVVAILAAFGVIR
ncbi:hypothetical protein Rsub_10854 [Raphidocelis subcapitata]|uniref:DUF4112 domain-containing protein n=1 Tax=Raphidocelis subcapitata TaxID=307507 RepID=A0A2V0PE26_9CHLO|nr:hypothetical protein Rsub_10854 [Raphidocelis subcapitata]|eukprot:GBF98108.1 hypothetical protein Rsub_10854 [Raphidocelis subcapitata]